MNVKVLHKVNTDFRPADPGSNVWVEVDSFDTDDILMLDSVRLMADAVASSDQPDNGILVGAVLDTVYRVHQRVDNDPRHERCVKLRIRSLSVGDIVDLDGKSYACEPVGWRRLPN